MAEYYRAGIFFRDSYPLNHFHSRWILGIKSQNSAHFGDAGGEELLLPIESYFNGNRTLYIDSVGRVYLNDKKADIRTELKIVEGEWCYDASDHWQSLFDDPSSD
jgi:hypothetical protein